MYVAFTDDTESTISAVFAAPSDPTVYPYQGQVTTSDLRYLTFYDSFPEFARGGMPAPTASDASNPST